MANNAPREAIYRQFEKIQAADIPTFRDPKRVEETDSIKDSDDVPDEVRYQAVAQLFSLM
jgi:type III secretion system FlhB-like substrate exporter